MSDYGTSESPEEKEALKSAMEKLKREKKKKDRMMKVAKVVTIVVQAVVHIFTIAWPIIAFVLLITCFMFTLTGDEADKNAGDDSSYQDNLQNQMELTELSEYLLQFSHTGEAPQSADGKYYKMYSDGKWPTIGNSDLQWATFEDKFDCAGKILQGDKEKTVSSVKDYVNSFLTKGSTAQYTVDEVNAMNIYVEKELVDSIGAEACQNQYNYVETVTSDLSLSKQQLYALTSIAYNFGYLPERNGYNFKGVYEAGAGLYEINSWEHNRFIWDNWWCYLGGGMSGHIPARDAAYETYVKGIYDFSESAAGEVFTRSYYIYYTQEQLDMFDYAPAKTITRDITNQANEIEIFTYNQGVGTTQGSQVSGDILSGCQEVMQDLLRNNVKYSLTDLCWNNIKESNNFAKYKCCCATYVTVVLYRTGILTEAYINKYNYNWTGPLTGGGVNTMLRDAGWRLVSVDEAQPGDVCVYWINSSEGGHAFIYAGGNAIWDQTSGCISASGSQPTRGTANLWNYFINLCNDAGTKLYVWRAP